MPAQTPVCSITRAATRKPGEPLNILTAATHEAWESGLCKTGHQFYALRGPGIKDWNTAYRPLPTNYILLNPDKGARQLPPEVDFDLVFSQNRFGQFQPLSDIAWKLHLPLVTIEHTQPVPEWDPEILTQMKAMRGHINVFISDFSREAWGWKPEEARVVHHGIDTDTFSPNDLLVDKKNHLLSVVNDWKNRNWCCGYELWKEVSEGLPVFVVGDTPGLSKPAASVAELVMRYRESRIFLNTSLVSPVPTALLEAMASGCAVVSTATSMIPEVIEHGVNGLMSNDPKALAEYCRTLLKDPDLCQKLGQAARETILKTFSLQSFIDNWNKIFEEAANIVFTGVP